LNRQSKTLEGFIQGHYVDEIKGVLKSDAPVKAAICFVTMMKIIAAM
jgi:hypothetical protein